MAKFKVVDGARTHLRLPLPENFERSVQAALAEAGCDKDTVDCDESHEVPRHESKLWGKRNSQKLLRRTWAANGREMPTTWPASEVEIE